MSVPHPPALWRCLLESLIPFCSFQGVRKKTRALLRQKKARATARAEAQLSSVRASHKFSFSKFAITLDFSARRAYYVNDGSYERAFI